MRKSADSSALVPAEDAIEALIDHLVSPLLPIVDPTEDLPSLHQQEMVAKQMHAAVILYNYYHRKQFPDLEFHGFESFCKIASIVKPGLMKYMNKCEKDLEASVAPSITEKVVMEACNICTTLDASKDFPDIEGWPISKVAVFLVDTTKKKCLLSFSSITQGVWSVVEKFIEPSLEKLIEEEKIKRCLNKKRSSDGTSVCKPSAIEEELKKLAFSVVKQETGICLSDLSILECHVTYSLGNERESTQLYIMKYDKVVSGELTEVPVMDVINSLEGPIIERDLAPIATPVVEYFRILPYIDIISNWLQRETTHGGLHVPKQKVMDENCSLLSSRMLFMEDQERKKNSDIIEQTVKSERIVMQRGYETTKFARNGLSSMNESSGIGNSHVDVNRSIPVQRLKHQSINDFRYENEKSPDVVSSEHTTKKPNKLVGSCVNQSSGNFSSYNVESSSNHKKLCHTSLQNIADSSCMEPDRPTTKDQIVDDKTCQSRQTKENAIVSNQKVAGPRINGLSETVYSCKSDRSSLYKHQEDSCLENIKDQNIIRGTSINKNENKSIHHGGSPSADQLKEVSMTESDKTLRLGKSTDYVKMQTGVTNQDGGAGVDLPIVPMQFNSDNHVTFYQVMESNKSDLLQASRRVLLKKRDELRRQQRFIADEIAQCEMIIHTTLIEGEENLASNVKPMIEALNILCSSQLQLDSRVSSEEKCDIRTVKMRKLSEAVFSLKSTCQELDDICHMNNWTLPQYIVLPSFTNGQANGRFEASVTAQGMDFKYTCGGDPKDRPHEARNSAASHMLFKLRSSTAGQQQ